MITFCYYVLLTVVALTSFTIATRNSGPFAEQLSNYFTCETRGNDPNNPCDRNTFRQLAIPWLTVVSLVLIYMLPAINLVYALNIKELKEKFMCSAVIKKFKSSSTAQTSSNMSTS